MKQRKPIPCKVCLNDFTPYSTTSRTCSLKCSVIDVQNKKDIKAARDTKIQEKAVRKQHVARKRTFNNNDKPLQMKLAQRACNAYIRARDGMVCISCGTQKPDIQYCAGHWKSRGAHGGLRFHPFNLNSQCNKNCNLHLSGNVEKYKQNLIKKIGLANVEWLQTEQPPQKWTVEDLIEIKQYYLEQLRLLT